MKTLTLTQPWATLVAIGAKRIETRSWSTSHRGPLVIHAAKGGFGRFERDLASCRKVLDLMRPYVRDDMPYLDQFPLGCVLATCELIGCESTDRHDFNIDGLLYTRAGDSFEMTEQERNFGNYDPHRFAWILSRVNRLSEPIPAKGAQGLWNWMGGE